MVATASYFSSPASSSQQPRKENMLVARYLTKVTSPVSSKTARLPQRQPYPAKESKTKSARQAMKAFATISRETCVESAMLY